MRTLTLIALAILTMAFAFVAAAQSAGTAGDSSKISTSTPLADDEAFAAYQRVTADVKPPKATKAPDPEYPAIPVDAEPNGVVVMLVGINTKGRVELVHVLRSSNNAFENSAVSTVQTWKFSPAKKDGKPIPVQVSVEMHFQK